MRKFLLYFAGFALVVGGFIAVMWPVPNWRLYDANWRPLAMTQAESFCAGLLFGERMTNEQDHEWMVDCIANSSYEHTPSVANSPAWGCQGLLSTPYGAGWPLEDCLAAMEAAEVWWLLDGGYTMEWNSGNKRPEVAASNIKQAPDRDGRDETGRL